MYKNVIFEISFVSWTKFPKRKRCFSFWFSVVYSQISFVNICLKFTTFRQILLDKIFLFLDPMNISWIRLKTVVLCGAKQTDDVLGYWKSRPYLVFLIWGITVVFVIKKPIVIKIVDFSVVLYTIC